MRAAFARVEGVDVDGRPVVVEGTGELARCPQHETDHLRGELCIDALTGDRGRAAMRRLRAAMRRLRAAEPGERPLGRP